MDNYKKLLDKAFENISTQKTKTERFEIPKAKGYFQGKKTIISNFLQMAAYLRRKPEHFQKFLLRELATSGQIENEKLVLNIRIPSSKVNQKIEKYVNDFVLCKECKKPDTEIIKEDRLSFIHCLACGAKYPIKGKIN